MKNKIIVVVVLGILAAGAGTWLVMSRSEKKSETTVEQKTEEVAPIPEIALKQWKDEAGFIFEYPENLKIKQNTEDNESYANLEITAEGRVGQIKILAQDTKLKGIEERNKEKMEDKRGRIDQGILFTIEADAGWEEELETIDKSWQFFYPTKPAAAGQVEDNSVEIEEVSE